MFCICIYPSHLGLWFCAEIVVNKANQTERYKKTFEMTWNIDKA